MTNFCVDCVSRAEPHLGDPAQSTCSDPRVSVPNPVTGKVGGTYCLSARQLGGLCGPEGRFFGRKVEYPATPDTALPGVGA